MHAAENSVHFASSKTHWTTHASTPPAISVTSTLPTTEEDEAQDVRVGTGTYERGPGSVQND